MMQQRCDNDATTCATQKYITTSECILRCVVVCVQSINTRKHRRQKPYLLGKENGEPTHAQTLYIFSTCDLLDAINQHCTYADFWQKQTSPDNTSLAKPSGKNFHQKQLQNCEVQLLLAARPPPKPILVPPGMKLR